MGKSWSTTAFQPRHCNRSSHGASLWSSSHEKHIRNFNSPTFLFPSGQQMVFPIKSNPTLFLHPHFATVQEKYLHPTQHKHLLCQLPQGTVTLHRAASTCLFPSCTPQGFCPCSWENTFPEFSPLPQSTTLLKKNPNLWFLMLRQHLRCPQPSLLKPFICVSMLTWRLMYFLWCKVRAVNKIMTSSGSSCQDFLNLDWRTDCAQTKHQSTTTLNVSFCH